MNTRSMFDRIVIRTFFEEIDRYLAAVDLFRAAGCEPTSRPERAPEVPAPVAPSPSLQAPSDVELR